MKTFKWTRQIRYERLKQDANRMELAYRILGFLGGGLILSMMQ